MHATMSEANGRRRLAIGVIFATILIDFIGYSILIPVLPRFEKTLGASAFQIGLITSLYALGLVLFLPLWGWMSDRVGRRPVLLASLLGTAISFLWLAFADTLTGVLLARFVGGFFGASIGTAQAYVTDLTDEHSRAQGMGVIGAASGAGLVLGTALGGVLGAIDPELPFTATAAVAAVNFVLAAFALPESKARVPTDTGLRGLLRVLVPAPLLVAASVHGRSQRIFLLLFLQIFFAFSAVESMFPLFAAARFGWGEMETGLYMAGVCVVLGASQVLLVGRLSREWGEVPMTIAGLALLGASLAGISVSDSFATLTPCAFGVALGGGLAFPAFTSLFSKACGAHEAGEYLSQSQAMVHTGRTLGALCWGWVFASLGAGAPFLIAGLALLGALVVFLSLSRVMIPQA
jgi:DHA1 family tetracycline resistance protein-like MFS transporter